MGKNKGKKKQTTPGGEPAAGPSSETTARQPAQQQQVEKKGGAQAPSQAWGAGRGQGTEQQRGGHQASQGRGRGRGAAVSQRGGHEGPPVGASQERGEGRGAPISPQYQGGSQGQSQRGSPHGRGGPHQRGQGGRGEPLSQGEPPRDTPPRRDERSEVPQQQVSPKTSVSSSLARLQIASDAAYTSKERRKPGVQGRRIKVESNHLQLNLGKIKTAYHYDVDIVPDKPKRFLRTVMEAFRRKLFPQRYPSFDGRKNLYSSTPLTNNLNDVFEEEVVISDENGRQKNYKVAVKFATSVDMTPLHNLLSCSTTPYEAFQVVDIVLRMAPVVSCLPVGRSFFVKPNQMIPLGEGMEMYNGFYQSTIRGWKPLLNVDVAHKAFPRNINVIDALLEVMSTGRDIYTRDRLKMLERYQEEPFAKFIKTLRIVYAIPGHPGTRKTYRVNGLGPSASRAMFDNNGQQISVNDYFTRVKNVRLRYPDLPTLWVGNQTRKDKVYLPIELCEILEGQAVNKRMTETQTSKMIRHAATDTTTRKNKIVQGIRQANYNDNPSVKEFGFSVGNEFQKLDARVLNPPELQYANRSVRVVKGVWRNETFLKPVTINKWTFVSASRYPVRPDDYKRMTDLFEKCGRDVGINFTSRATEPFGVISGRQTYIDVEQYFRTQKGKQFDIIFVVVPDSGPQYSYVKKAAEIGIGCLTQCIKSSTVGRKMNPQTAANILLKVNSKLNGVNHTFTQACKPNILKRPVMIMGADVTHPGPDSQNIPSVAAVTASHDPKAFQYNICWRLQNPKVEIIDDLEAIVTEHLKFFYKQTAVKPEAIVFFRDGVSEGQFEQVQNAEIRAIRAACKKVQKDGYEPKITFLVVQKRHHTRLFPLDPRDSHDRNLNVPAGTCVDSEITNPFLQDFYLVSHASIQGVAKPTKYVTLWDDNNMDNDQIEQLTYYLCHMFSRCNRSVSYPAPTYYAHLAAARAKVYIENDNLNMEKLREEFRKYEIKDEIRKGLPMFFV